MKKNVPCEIEQEKQHQLLGDHNSSEVIGCRHFEFHVPTGWKHTVYSDEIVLRKGNSLVLIYDHPHQSLADLHRVMQCPPDDPSLALTLESRPTQIADNAIAVNHVRGSGDNRRLVSRLIGTISPFGGGVFIWAIDLSGEISAEIPQHVDTIACGMRYLKLEDSELVDFISGVYEDAEGNQVLLLSGRIFAKRIRGHHLAYIESAFQESVEVRGMAAECEPFGAWTVIGDRKQGTITVTYEDDSSETIPFVVSESSGAKPLKMKLGGRNVKPAPEFQQVEIMRRVNIIIQNRQQDTIRR